MLRKSFFITCLLIFALFAICLVSCDDDESEASTDTGYKVGDVGPAGGIIFYDCDADNGNEENDGLESSDCGWRYLEAAPADLKIVNDIPTVDSSAEGYSGGTDEFYYGFYRESTGGSNLFVNGTTDYNSSNCTGTAIGTGKDNTKLLVDTMKEAAYTFTSGESTTSNYAARLCDILVYTKDGKTYDDWFLPSKDELNLMYTILYKENLGAFTGDSYWSSSEDNDNVINAWQQYFNNGNPNNFYRYSKDKVRPVRAFLNDEVCEHTWDEGEVTVEATFNHNGIKTYTCTECHMTKVEIIPILTPEVGKAGPTGGIIFYDCDADNEDGNTDGLTSSDCGWRYLEAAPADLKIVAGTPTVDSDFDGYSGAGAGYVFGYYRSSSDGDNLYVNGETNYDSSNCTGTAIGTGKTNTNKLVGKMGDTTYSLDSGSETTTNYAARLCDILEYTKDGVKYDDWFLPSIAELNLMNTNLKAKSLGDFESEWYWSSSEDSVGADYALLQFFSIDMQGSSVRDAGFRVRPVRAFI